MYAHKDDSLCILDSIIYPDDLRKCDVSQLRQVSDELRAYTVDTVTKTGGHLGAGLGVVELTVALHYVFDTPNDLLVWDIGHQAYPHKILTGRKHLMHTLRTAGGISGFLKRSESPYDTFGAGHSSTSISAALGMAVASKLKGEERHVIAVIGDGALTAGMAYEAMNNAGHMRSKMIVVLNDNEMSIAPNVGAMSHYLNRLISSKPFLGVKHIAKSILHHMPQNVENLARKTSRYAKDIIMGGNLFEEMGFHYVGPLDGHDVENLVFMLNAIKSDDTLESPVLVHLKTEKGRGFCPPFRCDESYHAIGKLEAGTLRKISQSAPCVPTYTKVASDALCSIARSDDRIVAITAAMPSGTGLDAFCKEFPERMFDVGIAEQHAVTFAAGLAAEGMKPYVAIYSTFMQRAYDQVIHDVAIQSLPVRFLMDRAGVVGADGATHAGVFDIAYMACIPGVILMAPSDENELNNMILFSATLNEGPCCIRYPRGAGIGVELDGKHKDLEVGKGRVVRSGARVAILSVGTRLVESLHAADMLALEGTNITVADARFIKPLDEELVLSLAGEHQILITIEEGSMGGFGSIVGSFLSSHGILDGGTLKFRQMCIPDIFVDHGESNSLYEAMGMNSSGIYKMVKELL